MFNQFDEWVQQGGDRPAVRFQQEILTYADLSCRIHQLMNYLQQQGLTAGSRVGICLDRNVDAVVALLAILRLGGTYIPLDPAYPQERLAFMVAESQPQCVLVQSATQTKLPAQAVPVINLDKAAAAIAASALTCEVPPVELDSVAYIMYTSGSTGKPKGVEMSRRSLSLYLQAIAEVLRIQPTDVYLHTASFSFSSSVRQLLVPLSAGATLVLASRDDSRSPLDLLRLMQAQQVTVSDTVASVWRSVLQAMKPLDQPQQDALLHNSLRLVLLSGALTSCKVFHQIRQSLTSQPQIVNIYGQTETIGVTAYPIPAEFDRQEGYVPVGFPYAHNRTYILDETMHPVPPGEVGELYVSGGCLANGYLARPELTAQQFLANPWADHTPDPSHFARLYRTGDVARQHPDGALEIRGRTDFQVKIRGMRVELGEIEQVIEHLAIAKEAIVTAVEDLQGELRLVAYVVAQPDYADAAPAVFSAQLKAELQPHLTDYLVPSLVVPLAALPLTPNGKRDRKALPAPDWSQLSTKSASDRPANEIESTLLAVWCELFGFEPGLQDSFFDLGGTSLLAVQLFSQIDARFHQKLSFNHLLAHPTIRSLADYIRQDEQRTESVVIFPLQAPVNPSRPPLFCIHGVGGGALTYQALLPYLPTDQAVYGIQSRGFDGIEAPLETVEEMATLYLSKIREVYPHGPICLLGHSFGGFIAYEMAQQLQHQGDSIGLLALADTKTPELAKTPPSIRQLVVTILRNLWLMPHAERWHYLGKSVRWFYRKRRLGRDREYADKLARENPQLRMFNVLRPNYAAAERYQPQPYAGEMLLLRALIQSPRSSHSQPLGWDAFLDRDRIHIHTVPGDHLNMMEGDHLSTLVEVLRQYLDRVQIRQVEPVLTQTNPTMLDPDEPTAIVY